MSAQNSAGTDPDPIIHGAATVASVPPEEVAAEDALRARVYVLIAQLLAAPPGVDLLAQLSSLDSHADPQAPRMMRAWALLALAARESDAALVEDEYHQLFIGLGRGELVPYASWYLTGFLMERPLSELRQRLASLGLERAHGVHDPEDHIAALCEVMALLISDSAYGPEVEQEFCRQHLLPWAGRFFEDLEQSTSGCFYHSVARLGAEFMVMEQRCLSMAG